MAQRWAGAVCLLLVPAALAGQRPTVSPPLARALGAGRDTTYSVWLFVRPAISLADAAAQVGAAGATVTTQSRWLHAVSARASVSVLRQLAGVAFLRHVQPMGRWRVPRTTRPGPPALEAPTAGDTCAASGDPVYGPSEMPYRALNLRPLSDGGTDGSGVRIAILDAGFNTLNPAFSGVTVTAQHDFVFNDSVVRDQPNDQAGAQFHGTAVWSLFAANVPGRLIGIARGASYLLAKTEDIRSETRVEESNYVAALEWADSIGVDIASSSLGYLAFDNGFSYTPSQLNGDVAVTTVAADSAAARGILVVTAAGNDGPGFRTLVTPGDADSVITAGAEDSLGTIASFSSRGPTADGRLKPDLTAPGVAVCTIAGGPLGRLDGTSFATPILAAAAALVKQLHPTLGPIALRDALRVHATNHASPDSTRGWGRPDVSAAAVFPAGVIPLAPLPPAFTTVTPDFSWSAGSQPAFAQPISYRLRIGNDSGFVAPLFDTTLTIEQYALRRPLKPGKLYWRVDATSAPPASLTATTGVVGPIAVPAWAKLTTLDDSIGGSTADPLPTFTWTSPLIAAPPGPFQYDLFVLRTGQTIPVFGIGGLTGTSYQITKPLDRNATYQWHLVVHAGPDTSLVRSRTAFIVLDSTLPHATLLYQNFPNPFPAYGQSVTCLWFDLARASIVQLAILDLRGNVVRRILPSAAFPLGLGAGRYGRGAAGGALCDPNLTWDGRADDGRDVPAGVYLYKLDADGVIQFKRIVFRGRTP